MAFDRKKVLLIVLLFVLLVIFVGIIYMLFQERGDDVTMEDPIELGRFTNPSLKFVAVIFRHGDRAPLYKLITNPHENAFPEGIGELTKKGKQHMYKKGQILRHTYNGFISDLYSDNEILIKSTPVKRTLMSALMVVAGMYPPESYQKWSNSETIWQPIPVYTNSPDHGTVLDDGNCPYFKSISNKMFFKYANNYDKNISVPLFMYLTEKYGQEISERNLYQIYDIIMSQISEGLLPEWMKPHHIQEISSLVNNKTNLEELYGNSVSQKLIIGPLLTEIGLSLEFYKNNSNYNTTRKMHLYAGHDITLTTIMYFLGKIIKMPDFGASLHFHLYYDDTIGYNIKIFYYNQWDNAKGEEVSIFNCQKPCKIQDFKKLLTNLSVNWDEECQKMDTGT